ncbi:MAG: RidA family protein [Betaproteobacteria bacterium]|nr:MAG: RidA family protein [Betaproteobacteria bacterium]
MREHEIAARLREAGIELPAPPRPAGLYRPVICRGGMGFVSGQFPIRHGNCARTGRVGAEVSPEEGRECAALAAANVLAQIRAALGGWERFEGLCRLDGYVASAADFLNQPAILDGASEFFVRVLGPTLGAHARTAFHVPRLPLDAPVELAVTFFAH